MRPVLVMLASLCAIANAAPVSGQDSVMVGDAWAPPSLAGARSGVAYLSVMNHGGPADRLLGASTPVAAKAELHGDELKDGVMSMRRVGPLALAPGEVITLTPGGLHLMLLGLRQPLKPGEHFPITLTFEHHAPITVEADVRGGSASGDAHSH
jgi:copper(I)-binding protein